MGGDGVSEVGASVCVKRGSMFGRKLTNPTYQVSNQKLGFNIRQFGVVKAMIVTGQRGGCLEYYNSVVVGGRMVKPGCDLHRRGYRKL